MSRLCSSHGPGNVRQLENAVEMAVAVSGDNDISRSQGLRFDGSGPSELSPSKIDPESCIPADESLDFETAVSRL